MSVYVELGFEFGNEIVFFHIILCNLEGIQLCLSEFWGIFELYSERRIWLFLRLKKEEKRKSEFKLSDLDLKSITILIVKILGSSKNSKNFTVDFFVIWQLFENFH